MEILFQFVISLVFAAVAGGIAVAFVLAPFWPVFGIVFIVCFLGVLIVVHSDGDFSFD